MNTPLRTVNRDEKKAETNATTIPIVYSVSKLKIRNNPATTMTPNTNSKGSMRRWKNSGSSKAVYREDAERQARVTDTVEILMAWKNSIQWAAMISPTKA